MAVDKGRGKAKDGDKASAEEPSADAQGETPATSPAAAASDAPDPAEAGQETAVSDQPADEAAADPEDSSEDAAADSASDDDNTAPAAKDTPGKDTPAKDSPSAKGKDSNAGKSGASKKKPKAVSAAPKRPAITASTAWVPIAAFVAGVLFVAAATAVVVFYLQARDRGQQLTAGREASEAACAVVRGFVSYDATKQNMDDWARKLADQGTTHWKDKFMPVFQELKAGIIDQQVKSMPRDVQCGVAQVESDKKTVKVVVSVYQVVQSKATQGRASRQLSGMTATVKKADGRWLVEDLDSQLFHDQ